MSTLVRGTTQPFGGRHITGTGLLSPCCLQIVAFSRGWRPCRPLRNLLPNLLGSTCRSRSPMRGGGGGGGRWCWCGSSAARRGTTGSGGDSYCKNSSLAPRNLSLSFGAKQQRPCGWQPRHGLVVPVPRRRNKCHGAGFGVSGCLGDQAAHIPRNTSSNVPWNVKQNEEFGFVCFKERVLNCLLPHTGTLACLCWRVTAACSGPSPRGAAPAPAPARTAAATAAHRRSRPVGGSGQRLGGWRGAAVVCTWFPAPAAHGGP